MQSILKLRKSNEAIRFEGLVLSHRDSIYRVAYRLCGNRDDAEDLIQESLIEAFQAFGRFTPGTHFDRWVFRIMRNTFLDGVRGRPRGPVGSLDAPCESESGTRYREIIDISGEPETRLLAETLDGPIQQALQMLPADFRIVVILADLEEMTYDEISRTLDCPVGTVRSRLHRGRAILKDKLKKYVRFNI